jgi:hypothetical protein
MKRYILTALAVVAFLIITLVLSTCGKPQEAEENSLSSITTVGASPTIVFTPTTYPIESKSTDPEPSPLEPFAATVVRTGYVAGSILVNREPVTDDEIAEYERLIARMPSLSDIDETARMVWGEARGLSSESWVAVTWVVINRWHSDNRDYQNCETVFDVLTQRNGGSIQFSGYKANHPCNDDIRLWVVSAFADFAEGKADPTGGALFFNGFGSKIVTWDNYADFNDPDKGLSWK